MRILYIAKHGSGLNDDEGAIAFALGKLGHVVKRVQETEMPPFASLEADFILFHKWSNFAAMRAMKGYGIPLVFWYFDLVDWPQDLTLKSRCESRKMWMANVIPLVDLGFSTDGDWVERDKSGKLHVLRQGADERVVGFGTKQGSVYDCDVLFVGGVKGCGVQRESFLSDLQKRYKERFFHVGKGVYGRSLANLIASAKVVVCPDSPVTDRYWSNRVYVLGGFGACLLMPRETGVDFGGSYENRQGLFSKIDFLLGHENVCEIMARETLESVKNRHLYRHRCEELVRVVKERLGI